MLFEGTLENVHILSAGHMAWGSVRRHVKARNFHALTLRVRGDATFYTSAQTLKTRENELLFLPAGLAYDVQYSAGEIYVIHFTADGVFKNIQCTPLSDASSLLPLFRRLQSVWETKRTGYRFEMLSLFYEILCAIERQESGRKSACDAFSRTLERIKQDFKEPNLQIGLICAQEGISESYFRRCCKRELECSPIQYLTELRLSNAQHLLRFPSCSVERAALESGFTDVKYFARVVKKYRGCKPSDLRL